jgi:hypothetical protein
MFRRTTRTPRTDAPQDTPQHDDATRGGVTRVVQDPNTPGGFRNVYEPPTTTTEGEE